MRERERVSEREREREREERPQLGTGSPASLVGESPLLPHPGRRDRKRKGTLLPVPHLPCRPLAQSTSAGGNSAAVCETGPCGHLRGKEKRKRERERERERERNLESSICREMLQMFFTASYVSFFPFTKLQPLGNNNALLQ